LFSWVDSSYRTYEEWKLDLLSNGTFSASSSYRTYEEWKHKIDNIDNVGSYSSYRTYEEWKHILSLILSKSLIMVLTVPMRNGNQMDFLAIAIINKWFLPYL